MTARRAPRSSSQGGSRAAIGGLNSLAIAGMVETDQLSANTAAKNNALSSIRRCVTGIRYLSLDEDLKGSIKLFSSEVFGLPAMSRVDFLLLPDGRSMIFGQRQMQSSINVTNT